MGSASPKHTHNGIVCEWELFHFTGHYLKGRLSENVRKNLVERKDNVQCQLEHVIVSLSFPIPQEWGTIKMQTIWLISEGLFKTWYVVNFYGFSTWWQSTKIGWGRSLDNEQEKMIRLTYGRLYILWRTSRVLSTKQAWRFTTVVVIWHPYQLGRYSLQCQLRSSYHTTSTRDRRNLILSRRNRSSKDLSNALMMMGRSYAIAAPWKVS